MKFTKIAISFLAAFAIAAPTRSSFDSEYGVTSEHVPDETKRQTVDEVIESISDNLINAIPDQIDDQQVLDKVIEDIQKMVTGLLSDSNEIFKAAGGDFGDLKSFISENELYDIFETADFTRRGFLPPVAKVVVIKLVKIMLKKLLESLLEISKDTGATIDII